MTTTPLRPIFVFSLPRSGSTLLQRLIASHEAVSSAAEPWLLLPPFYALRRKGVDAEYQHQTLYRAIEDLITELPGGLDDYSEAVHDFALAIYRKLSEPGTLYFLDKTPHYSLIAKEIIQAFPEGKFVFLWRNPLAAMGSMFDAWPRSWPLDVLYADLVQGLDNLISCSSEFRDRVITLRYEDLIADPDNQLRRIFSYLELPYQADVVEGFNQLAFRGRMGDRWGSRLYAGISSEPLQKWRASLSSPLRKWWCRRYLAWLGTEKLAVMGYDIRSLTSELKDAPVWISSIANDFYRLYRTVGRAIVVRNRPRRALRLPPGVGPWNR